jgi:hypothetical protein
MKYSPSMIPQFIARLEQATKEQEIQSACHEIKSAVAERWDNESTRRKPMSEIRKAVRERFPVKVVDAEIEADFPYFYTASGKRRDVEKNILNHRLEHLAIKHLSEEWNAKPEVVEPEVVKPETVKPEVVKPETVKTEVDILDEVGLTNDEVEQVKKALGESDVREWVRQAIIQRANAINNKKAVMDEDLSEVPSEILMNEKKYRTNPTAARELVNRAVRVVKQWNLDHPDQKWCITNKLIGELTGVTVKAIAKAVEGMDLESYNKSHDLTPVVNRMVKGSCGEASQVMSIANVTGIEGTEENYR